MTIEELKKERAIIRGLAVMNDDNLANEVIETNNIQNVLMFTLDLIDSEIVRLSVTDEDVLALTGEPVINYSTKSATSIKQIQTEECEYCNEEMEQFFEIIDANFCMRCGRKLR